MLIDGRVDGSLMGQFELRVELNYFELLVDLARVGSLQKFNFNFRKWCGCVDIYNILSLLKNAICSAFFCIILLYISSRKS